MTSTYVVTGAASGIGAATAALLREQGHRVFTIDRATLDGPDHVEADLSTSVGRAAAVDRVPAIDMWRTKRALRERLVVDARRRLLRSRTKRGATKAELGWIDGALDPDVLTIGFARRAASYKRLTLMLRDPDRLPPSLHAQHDLRAVCSGVPEAGKIRQDSLPLARTCTIRHPVISPPAGSPAAMPRRSGRWRSRAICRP